MGTDTVSDIPIKNV